MQRIYDTLKSSLRSIQMPARDLLLVLCGQSAYAFNLLNTTPSCLAIGSDQSGLVLIDLR